jgi:malate dehydrogenase
MAVPSDGSYGVPRDLVFSFPVTISTQGDYSIVQGLNMNSFAQEKMKLTIQELEQEREAVMALINK